MDQGPRPIQRRRQWQKDDGLKLELEHGTCKRDDIGSYAEAVYPAMHSKLYCHSTASHLSHMSGSSLPWEMVMFRA
jgi:hypothetical protein